MAGEPDADRRRADGDGTSILTVFAVIGCALAVAMLLVFLFTLNNLKARVRMKNM